MDTKDYKKIVNSQKIAAEINEASKNREEKSSAIEDFTTSKPDLANKLYNRLNDTKRTTEISDIINNIDKEKNVEHLLQAISKKNRSIVILKAVSSVAAILVISLMAWLVVPEKNSTQQANNETQSGKSLNPTLKLSSGEVYEVVANVDNATGKDINYIVEKDSKMNLSELQKKIYGDSAAKSEDILHLELSIPDKSSYTVILSDSSEVILNANSSISYPEKFTKDKREVTIKGEAYFNVKKSKIPFVVNIGNSYVKVYGTAFNINARDTKIVKTTLVSGVVGVGAKDIAEQILKPNQMAIVNIDSGKCLISDVDAENSTGWVMGSIICIDNNLESLINDLEAWYGVDIRYDKHKDAVKNIRMNILIKHTMRIDEALKLIEKVTDVKFINEGGYYSIKIN